MQENLVFLGVVAFQMILVFLQWVFFKRKEFLWYILYLLAIFFYIYIYNEKSLAFTNWFYPNYHFQFITLRVIGFITLVSYVIFGRSFIDLNQLYPEMKQIVQRLQNTIWICTCIFIIVAFICPNLILLENISFIFYTIFFLFSAIMNLILIKKRIVLNNFIIVGSIFAIVGGSIEGILETIQIRQGKAMFVSNVSLEIGCVLEFICLNIGFLYKSKLIQNDEITVREASIKLLKEKEEISTRLQNIQKEYSMDLHDEIGTTLSSISIYNQLMAQTIDQDLKKAKHLNKKMKESIHDVISITEEIIWGLKIKSNQSNFLQRLENYALIFLLVKNIQWQYEIDENISAEINSPIYERNILLIIKEALNNCGKYSHAQKLLLKMYTQKQNLIIWLQDDGVGSQQMNTLGGNGIQNMKHRCEKMNGTFSMESLPNKGTRIECIIPVNATQNQIVV